MALLRSGFLGGARQGDALDRDAEHGFGSGRSANGVQTIRLGDPHAPRSDSRFETPPGFDPIWGTLGAPQNQHGDDWLTRSTGPNEGVLVDVEIFGNGFQVSGQIQTGQFDRLSDWLNMQTGFIQVHDAWHVHLGQTTAPDPGQRKGTLWVRLDQVVLVAERSPVQQSRPGAPVVQKQRRKVSIVTPGYNLIGNIHIHAYGSMAQFLESPDPRFLPITDLTVRWLSEAAMVGRYPFAMINRQQLVTILDEAAAPVGGAAGTDQGDAGEDDLPLHRRWGAA
jgi:hypothetical protein